MKELIIDIVATPKLMAEILALAKALDIEASTPLPIDSSSDALDAPLGVDGVREVLEIVTLIVSTGTTVVEFLNAVKALMKRTEDDGREPRADIIENSTQRKIGTVTAETNIEKLRIDP